MKVDINQPVGFSEVGQRTNNEDSIFPAIGSATSENRLFLVCDGVGGQHKGEVASAMACESIRLFFDQNPVPIADKDYIIKALEFTVKNFNDREISDPETTGMATTLTLLHFNEAGATIAHLGDSRIYQVRNGKIIHVSVDHKLVNELVRDGHITEEEALNHTQRNVITKVISADRNDVPDVHIISDISAGDYFFLCTDGVLEQIYDELLAYHLRETDDNEIDDAQKLENIRLECFDKTRDNFTAYLVRVHTVSGKAATDSRTTSSTSRSSGAPIPVPTRTTDIRNNYQNDAPTVFTKAGLQQLREFDNSAASAKKSTALKENGIKRKLIYFAVGIAIAVIPMAGYLYFTKKSARETKVVDPVPVENKTPTPESTRETLEKAVEKTTTKLQKEKKKEGKEEKKALKPIESSFETIDKSQNGKFYIIKDLGKHYAWEPSQNKKTEIVYDDFISIKGYVHHYYLADSKKHFLYFIKPNLKISDVDPNKNIETGEDTVTYFSKGTAHTMNTVKGKEWMPTVDEVRKTSKAPAVVEVP